MRVWRGSACVLSSYHLLIDYNLSAVDVPDMKVEYNIGEEGNIREDVEDIEGGRQCSWYSVVAELDRQHDGSVGDEHSDEDVP